MQLGAGIYNIVNMDGVECFDFSSQKFVTAEVKKVEDNMAHNNDRIPSKFKGPLEANYHPKVYVSAYMKSDGM